MVRYEYTTVPLYRKYARGRVKERSAVQPERVQNDAVEQRDGRLGSGGGGGLDLDVVRELQRAAHEAGELRQTHQRPREKQPGELSEHMQHSSHITMVSSLLEHKQTRSTPCDGTSCHTTGVCSDAQMRPCCHSLAMSKSLHTQTSIYS